MCTMYTYTPIILAGICTQNSILGYTVYYIFIYPIELAGICTQICNMATYICTMYTYTPIILAGICTQNSILGYTVY